MHHQNIKMRPKISQNNSVKKRCSNEIKEKSKVRKVLRKSKNQWENSVKWISRSKKHNENESKNKPK